MADIDWDMLREATNTDNKPTPGYVFNDIVQNIAGAQPKDIPAVAQYLADCVDGDHAHVKLKALFVIKTLAFRIPPFRNCMQEPDRLSTVREATNFTGPPSNLYGDEPYRLVREAAECALETLTGGEYYHEQYKEMSKRIVGFGNFQPSGDTRLPDGSVNLTRDLSLVDFASSTISLIQSGAGAVIGGVKEIISGPFLSTPTIEGTNDADDREEQGLDDRVSDDGYCEYQPSVGEYIPPPLPAQTHPTSAQEDLMDI